MEDMEDMEGILVFIYKYFLIGHSTYSLGHYAY